MNLRRVIAFCGSLLLTVSCEKESIYLVPANIQVYVDDFLAEAASRGHDVEIDELVVLFEEDLEVGGIAAAGICTRSRKDPPTIRLDTTSINWRANLSSREQLVFHELGHCVLNRSHLDDRLPNGNFATMMRATGEQIYGPVQSGFKRMYYLDELFDEETPAPAWSQDVLMYDDIPPTAKTVVYEEYFDDESGGWSTGESANTRREILNGVYILTVKVPDNYYVSNTLDIAPGRDFELEAGVHVDGDGFSGMLWAGDEREEEVPGFNTVFFDDDVISIGTLDDGTESSYVYGEFFTQFYNKVTIRRVADEYFYYVNGNLVDNMGFNGIAGDQVGLAFGGLAGIKVIYDYLTLSYLD
jgi:hypothetical protein